MRHLAVADRFKPNLVVGPKKKAFRADIQGLRTVAVLAVIADHLFKYPTGGFVGVDIFFVISGFLITGLLLREFGRNGRISFADFYRRRARRILPLSVLVLAVTVVASWLVYTSGRAARVTVDGLWSLVFGTNWHLIAVDTDYMQGNVAVSPLQHFWSLAVEEQFYLVWPWVIVLVLGVLTTQLKFQLARARQVLVLAMIVLIATSLIFAFWETTTSPTSAYFSTFSRAWELGLGAVLAVVAGALTRIPQAMRPCLAYVGLAGIFWAIFATTPATPFPAPGALLPVLSTILVIAAGTGGEVKYLAPITNPVSRYIGDISFSLYLWHFPAIVILGAILPFGGVAYFGCIILATVVLSVVSYHFLEDRIRKSSWLEPKVEISQHRLDSYPVLRRRPFRITSMALAAVVVFGALAAVSLDESGFGTFPGFGTESSKSELGSGLSRGELTTGLEAAVRADVWPALSPSADNLGNKAWPAEWVQDACLVGTRQDLQGDIAKADTCVYGDPMSQKTAIVVGDSMAISYVTGIRAALEPRGYRVIVYTMMMCPAATVTVAMDDGSSHPRCDPFREWALGKVRELQPDLLIMSSSESSVARLASKATGRAAMDEWSSGVKTTLLSVASSVKKAVVLAPPPGGKPLMDCATRLSKPSDCLKSPSKEYQEQAAAMPQIGKSVADRIEVDAVDTQSWFCAGDSCPAFVGTSPVYADGAHLTPNYSAILGPELAAALDR